YAVVFGGESGLQKAGLSGIHPLTQRYVFLKNEDDIKAIALFFHSMPLLVFDCLVANHQRVRCE
ncbi:DUF3265 domain-containing protein, partial [Vibrio vulnificus]|nr:DUF3265 domain-containing protein [Vibrio vulnificus]